MKLKYPKTVIILVALLTIIGAVNILATTYFPLKSISDLLIKHLIYIFLGIILCIIISLKNYRNLMNPVFVNISILLTVGSLVLVLIIGESVYGAQRWISFGPLTVQPSEIAKLVIVITTAYFLNIANNQSSHRNKFVYYFLSFLIYMIFAALIMLQNSLGNTILITLIYLTMFVSIIDLNIKHLFFIATLFLLAALSFYLINSESSFIEVISVFFISSALSLFIFIRQLKMQYLLVIPMLMLSFSVPFLLNLGYNSIHQYQRDRIDSFLDPGKNATLSWNREQSLIACGSGRLQGKGFLQGTHTNYRYLPFSYTDFAFCSFGEQFGFLGSGFLLIIYLALFILLIDIYGRSKSVFSSLLIVGIVSNLLFNTVQHIGMNIGILPITGVPLPFVSYGGTSLLIVFILIGLLNSIYNTDGLSETEIIKVKHLGKKARN